MKNKKDLSKFIYKTSLTKKVDGSKAKEFIKILLIIIF